MIRTKIFDHIWICEVGIKLKAELDSPRFFRGYSGCSAARLARFVRDEEVGSSNLPTPTKTYCMYFKNLINSY